MKKIIFLVIIISLPVFIYSQDDGFYGPTQSDSKDVKKKNRQEKLQKWTFGGNAAFGFGSYTYIDVSPVALYSVTPHFQIGGGFTYIYSRFKNSYLDTALVVRTKTISFNTYGPRVITQLTLVKNLNEKININLGNLFIYSEFSYLHLDKYYLDGYTNEAYYGGSEWNGDLLAGGGFFFPFANRGGISIMVLYNFLEDEFTPYTNPVIRFGAFF